MVRVQILWASLVLLSTTIETVIALPVDRIVSPDLGSIFIPSGLSRCPPVPPSPN